MFFMIRWGGAILGAFHTLEEIDNYAELNDLDRGEYFIFQVEGVSL